MSPSPFETDSVKITVRPPQFGLRTLLVAAAAIGLTFGVLRWFEVSAAVGFFVLGVLIVAAVATAGLMAALLQTYTTIESAGKRQDGEGQSSDPFDKRSDDQSD